MARAYFRYVVGDQGGNSIQNAAVNVYLRGTTNQPTMYNAETGGSSISNPLLTNSQGEVEAWLVEGARLDIEITDNTNTAYLASNPSTILDFSTYTEVVDVQSAPADINSGLGTGGGVSAHTHDHTEVTDFDTGVRTNRLSEMTAPNADVSMNNRKITNVGAPVASSDALRLGDISTIAVETVEADHTLALTDALTIQRVVTESGGGAPSTLSFTRAGSGSDTTINQSSWSTGSISYEQDRLYILAVLAEQSDASALGDYDVAGFGSSGNWTEIHDTVTGANSNYRAKSFYYVPTASSSGAITITMASGTGDTVGWILDKASDGVDTTNPLLATHNADEEAGLGATETTALTLSAGADGDNGTWSFITSTANITHTVPSTHTGLARFVTTAGNRVFHSAYDGDTVDTSPDWTWTNTAAHLWLTHAAEINFTPGGGGSGSDIDITVPPDSTANFDIGTTIGLYNDGTGDLIVLEGSGVTIDGVGTVGKFGTLIKIAANGWLLIGDVTV